MNLPRRKRKQERGAILLWLLLVLFFVIVFGVVYLLRAPLLRGFAEWWVVDETLEPAQAIVVLAGDNRQGERVRRGVELLQAGLAPRLVLSGTSLRANFSETQLMEQDALAMGAAPEQLLLAPHEANSTLEEARALLPVLTQHNFRTIIVVTSNFQTRRARMIFRSLYQKRAVQVQVSAAPDSRFRPASWWQDSEGSKQLWLEWQKLVYARWQLWCGAPPATFLSLPLATNCVIVREPFLAGRGVPSSVVGTGRET